MVLVTQHRHQHQKSDTIHSRTTSRLSRGPLTQNRQLQHTGQGHMSSTGKPAEPGMSHTPVGSGRARRDISGHTPSPPPTQRYWHWRFTMTRRQSWHQLVASTRSRKQHIQRRASLIQRLPSNASAGTDRNMPVVRQRALTNKDMPLSWPRCQGVWEVNIVGSFRWTHIYRKQRSTRYGPLTTTPYIASVTGQLTERSWTPTGVQSARQHRRPHDPRRYLARPSLLGQPPIKKRRDNS